MSSLIGVNNSRFSADIVIDQEAVKKASTLELALESTATLIAGIALGVLVGAVLTYVAPLAVAISVGVALSIGVSLIAVAVFSQGVITNQEIKANAFEKLCEDFLELNAEDNLENEKIIDLVTDEKFSVASNSLMYKLLQTLDGISVWTSKEEVIDELEPLINAFLEEQKKMHPDFNGTQLCEGLLLVNKKELYQFLTKLKPLKETAEKMLEKTSDASLDVDSLKGNIVFLIFQLEDAWQNYVEKHKSIQEAKAAMRKLCDNIEIYYGKLSEEKHEMVKKVLEFIEDPEFIKRSEETMTKIIKELDSLYSDEAKLRKIENLVGAFLDREIALTDNVEAKNWKYEFAEAFCLVNREQLPEFLEKAKSLEALVRDSQQNREPNRPPLGLNTHFLMNVKTLWAYTLDNQEACEEKYYF